MAIKIHVRTNILTADLRMSVRVVHWYNFTLLPVGREGGGVLLISSDGDDWIGGKNQNPKTSRGVPTKPKKIVDQKLKKKFKKIPCLTQFLRWDVFYGAL